ncbi:MAG: hypothetical protein ACR2P2_09920 [Nakamurella sp.]
MSEYAMRNVPGPPFAEALVEPDPLLLPDPTPEIDTLTVPAPLTRTVKRARAGHDTDAL